MKTSTEYITESEAYARKRLERLKETTLATDYDDKNDELALMLLRVAYCDGLITSDAMNYKREHDAVEYCKERLRDVCRCVAVKNSDGDDAYIMKEDFVKELASKLAYDDTER